MMLAAPDLLSGLATIVGADSVLSAPEAMVNYLREPRRRFTSPAHAVVLPRSVEAVQAVMRFAHEHAIPVIPQGGNTGLVGGQVPLAGNEIILALQRLDRVRGSDFAAGHLTVEAGMTLEAVHKEAESHGTIFPLWLASQGSARIGGVLSTNAGGVQVLAYGNARELCLGAEAVLADGRLYNGLNALKKDNTGYDLKNLLIGSEGTLGIITAATLKLFPQPEGYETAIVNIPSVNDALALFYRMRERLNSSLTAFELIPHFGLELQLGHHILDQDPTPGPSPWYVLMEVSRPKGGPMDVLQSALERELMEGRIENAMLANSLAERTRMWTFRESMSEVQSKEGASIKHDVSVPIASVPQLIEEGSRAAQALIAGIRPCPFGHMGDGNIHFNFSQPIGADPKAFMAGAEPLHEAIYEIVGKLGGSVSAEHGIGQLKTDLLRRLKDPVALEMMRAIKTALDPKNLLNPGKMLG